MPPSRLAIWGLFPSFAFGVPKTQLFIAKHLVHLRGPFGRGGRRRNVYVYPNELCQTYQE